MREVGLHLLAAGHCLHPEAMTLRGGSLRPRAFPALPALILHPVEGPILFDTGYAPAFEAATEPFPERLYRWLTPMQLTVGQDAASLLRSRGIAAHDVRHVVLSHFHADHVAGLRDFPRAAVHCARGGLQAATSSGRWRAVCGGMLRGLLPADLPARARCFEDAARISLPPDLHPFRDAADLLGDGSLLAVELPGHCPGHWGLLVNDVAFGLHFLVADAAWSLQAVRQNRPPPWITTAFLGESAPARATLAALHALQRRNPEIRITPYHCQERAREAVAAAPTESAACSVLETGSGTGQEQEA
jgi:glyoxylase-like metal-dependent hydrolase (beta-lactamase superfamily II)